MQTFLKIKSIVKMKNVMEIYFLKLMYLIKVRFVIHRQGCLATKRASNSLCQACHRFDIVLRNCVF